jgi:hypothetical protein
MIHVATSGSECRRLEHFAVSNFDLASAARRVFRVVRHDDERRALRRVQFEQQVHDGRRIGRVEVAGWLVRD